MATTDFQLLTYLNSVDWSPKNLSQVITSATAMGVFWANVWNVIILIFIPSFLGTHLQVRLVGTFSCLMAQMMQTHARICFLGVSFILLSI